MTEKEIPIFRWNGSAWGQEKLESESNLINPNGLRTLLTWNILFSSWALEYRTHRIIETLQAHDPDVVCLQEVVEAHVQIFASHPWIQSNYYMTSLICEGGRRFGILALTRVLPHKALTLDLMDVRGRGSICLEFNLNVGSRDIPKIYRILTSHTDSSRSLPSSKRKECLEVMFTSLLKNSTDSVLLGDMNMHYPKEDTFIIPPFKDVWPMLRPGEAGYTYDSQTNAILIAEPDGCFRLDRVFVSSEVFEPKSIEIVGTETYVEGTTHISASDHFALLTKFDVRSDFNPGLEIDLHPKVEIQQPSTPAAAALATTTGSGSGSPPTGDRGKSKKCGFLCF